MPEPTMEQRVAELGSQKNLWEYSEDFGAANARYEVYAKMCVRHMPAILDELKRRGEELEAARADLKAEKHQMESLLRGDSGIHWDGQDYFAMTAEHRDALEAETDKLKATVRVLREGLEKAIFLIDPYRTDSAKLEDLLKLARNSNPGTGVMAEIEHRLSGVLVGILERHLNMDPCPAIKMANELAGEAVRALKPQPPRICSECGHEMIHHTKHQGCVVADDKGTPQPDRVCGCRHGDLPTEGSDAKCRLEDPGVTT